MSRATRSLLLTALLLGGCRPRPPAEAPVGTAPALVRAPDPGFEGTLALDVGGVDLPDHEQVDDRLTPLVPGERLRVTVDGDAPGIGAALPLITIVAFVDYQCPYSMRLTQSLAQLVAEDPTDVRVVFKQFPRAPVHPQAELAAAAALSAHAQGRFPAMHAMLFDRQQALTRRDLERYAQDVGLDRGRFAADLDSDRFAEAVARDVAQGTHFGVRSTPSFFINGRPFRGALPIEDLRPLLDEERALAQALMEAGAARPEIYARVMRAADPGIRRVPENAAAASGRPDPAAAYRVPVDGRPTDGPADALVTVVQFADFQCPFCARVSPTLAQLRQDHPRDVRLVWRNLPLPFHTQARDAAKAALAADRQGKFWAMHQFLFEHQKDLGPELYRKAAKRLGLDRRRFERDMRDPQLEAIISADENLAKQTGVRGTPAFFVNGRFLSGAQPRAEFEALVVEERDKARAWSASHPDVERRHLYERMTEGFATQVVAASHEAAPPIPAALLDPERQVIATAGLPRKGSPNARVEIVECADFDCPYCARSVATLAQLLRKRRHVALVFMQFPLAFHKRARAAHRAAVAADNQGKFWAMHELLYADQTERSDAELEAMARKVGLDLRRFRRDVADPATDARIDQESAICQRLGASGTPTFFFNGRRMTGARPLADFEQAADDESAGGGLR